MPRLREPIAVRSGAPRLEPPEPAYVWQAVQPAVAKSFAPGSALAGRCSVEAQRGTSWITSDASASLAVAPFHVSTPMETIVRTAATIATGRAEGRRTRRRSRNGSPISRTSAIVGTPIVPRNTDSGHLKIRSR